MQCPSCGYENRDDAKFCRECGATFSVDLTCPGCGAAHDPGQRFCDECGQSLATTSPLTPAAAQKSTDRPTSFADGRYQVERALGEGGKKLVYLAHDSLLDREVAFALIKTEGLDEASRERVSREAQAMGRLGSHPHIVTVFDIGDHDGTPYMVTEFMDGGDVEAMLEDSGDHRVSLEQALGVTRAVCRGLEFAHAKGIVHRDLKPGNVWLTSDGTAKIGDFGLAVATDRSRLTQEGMMVGTVSYMPPEQAMGGDVTPRSDLYSLGAMLYEMLTGRPPFVGDDSVAIIGQHINTPPVAPTWHNQSCPRPLEALILRLLAKDPSERPESAADVLRALEGIDLSDDVGAQGGAPEEDANRLDSLAGGVFVGRHREMDDLKAALEDSLSGRGRMVTLVGEPGIGKTRTAQELETYAGLRGAQVLWGRCYEDVGAPPYWPWVQAIRSYVRERDPGQLRSEMGAGAADIAEIVSDVRERLPDLKTAPPLEDPEQARFRLFDSIAAFLKGASAAQPMVVMLDDLHWADKPSLLLLEFVAREVSGARVLLIGTYRDMELNRRHPLTQTLGELTRERLFERVLLRGLTEGDVSRFIEVATGLRPPPGLVSAVHTQTEGNPLFVTEVVRLLVQEGELTSERLRKRKSWTVRIPEGVREVIGRRLDRLSERCNETLTIASAIGRQFELGHLDRLIDDLSEDRLLDVLEEALSARVIEELPDAMGRYQFTHALIHETLVEELSLTRRVRLHARIAEMLEELYGPEAEANAAELAHHFAQAEAVLGTEKLVRYSLLAGERAVAAYGYEEALVHFQRALTAKESQPMDAETAAALFGLGRTQAATIDRSQAQQAWDLIRQAFEYYVEAGDADRAVSVAQQVLGIAPFIKGRADVTVRALKLVPPDSLDAGRLLSEHGVALWWEEGDYDGASQAFDRAIAIARREGDMALEALALSSSVSTDSFEGRHESVLESGPRAVEIARSSNDLQSEVRARMAVALSLMVTGDRDGARQHATAMLEAAERLRHRTALTVAPWLLGVLSCYEGDWLTAHRFLDRALEGNPDAPPALVGKAVACYEVGATEEGDQWLERLVTLAGEDSKPLHDVASTSLMAVLPQMSRITGIAQDLDLAEATARSALATPEGRRPNQMRNARTGLALLAVHRSDAEAAAEQYQALRSVSGLMLRIPSDRLLGLLAHTMEKLDDAAAHFEDALDFCRKAGYRPELAWTCCDYADTLHERDGDGDRGRAVSLLDEALAISRDLGMRPLMERVLSRRKHLTA